MNGASLPLTQWMSSLWRECRYFIAAILITVTFITTEGCKKYEEGPAFSLFSKKMRLCSTTWVVDKVEKNGTDYTSDWLSQSPDYS